MLRPAPRLLLAIAVLVLAIVAGSCGDDTEQQSTVQQAQGQSRRSAATPAEARAKARSVARIKRRARVVARAEARKQRRRVRAQRKALANSQPENAPGDDCADGYDPCVPPYPPDVDCADLTGPYSVTGSDPHKLDPDGNGKACE